jgi:hypothetical protein
MAVEKGLEPLSFPASADLSARQYRCVSLASDGEVQAASAGAYVMGILQNKPAAVGRAASVQTKAGAVTKVSASTTAGVAITVGISLVSGANGIVLASSTGGTAYRFGRATEALSTGLTGIISAEITHEGPTSTA